MGQLAPLAARPRRSKGEKANKKQMAYVGAVYTIDRFCRTPEDVVDEIARKERTGDRPVPQHKQVWAEMTRSAEGAACTGRERLFVEMAIACHERDPTRRKTLVCLMDGEAARTPMITHHSTGQGSSYDQTTDNRRVP